MKTTKLLLTLLLISNMSFSQFKRFGHGENQYFTMSMSIDPAATIKESSPNLVFEIELVHYWGYIKATTQILPGLEGSYLDYGGAAGLNFQSGYVQETRWYIGGRAAIVDRGGFKYPLFGTEAGVDTMVTNSLFIGLRTTLDDRTDFEFWGGQNKLVLSGFVRIGIKF